MPNCPSCGTKNLSDDHVYCFNCGYNFAGATGKLAPETLLEGRYVIVEILGHGGMGAVYKALDQRLNNIPVAIKEMSTKAVGQGNLQAAVGAFKKEAAMLIGLRHPSLPRISDFFSQGENRWYLVMDYIEGETLKEIIERRGSIPELEVLNWARQVCLILDYLHIQESPVIFRDLKPANIMLTPEGSIKLIDFGIARHFRTGLTSDTTAYGSAGYAPPEQHGDKQTDARSDIYALGATLHYLITGIDPGKSPFIFESPGRIVKVSPRLESAIMKAVELKPENRPDSIKELLLMFPDKNDKNESQLDKTETLQLENIECEVEGVKEAYSDKPPKTRRWEVELTSPCIRDDSSLTTKTDIAKTQSIKVEECPKSGKYNRLKGKTWIAAVLVATLLLGGVLYGFNHSNVQQWEKTFDGNMGRDVQQTSDGGYIITGYTKSSRESKELCLIKTDSIGDKVWEKTFSGYAGGNAVQQTSDRGYILASTNGGHIYLVKTDVSGNKVWEKTFGPSEGNVSVQQTGDGGYILAGTNGRDLYLVKTDVSGNKVWEKTFGGESCELGGSVQQTGDGGYIIAGETYSFGTGLGTNIYLVKTDVSGNKVWEKTFSDEKNNEFNTVRQTRDGGYVIVGRAYTLETGSADIYLVKTDASGNKVWDKTFNKKDCEESGEAAGSVQQTSDGGYVIVGRTYTPGNGSDIYLVKIAASGNTLWEKTFGRKKDDVGYAVQQTSDGGYVIVGTTYSYGFDPTHGPTDIYLIKTDASGNIE